MLDIFFFFENYIVQRGHLNARTLTHMNTLRKTYLYEHLRRIEQADHEIHEDITRTSLSTGTSPTW
jgi:hypothetical protein